MLGSATCRAFDITLMKILNNADRQRKVSSEEGQFIIKVTDTHNHDFVELLYNMESSGLDQLSVLFYLSLVGTIAGGLCFGI